MRINSGLTILLVCLFFQQAEAKLQIGEIVKLAGARATVNGKEVKTSVPLFWGDRLFAGPDTTLDVLIYPSFAIKLTPSSEVKFIGNLVEKQGKQLLASTAIQALKGRLQARVYKASNVVNDIKVFGRRTMSSIRGTTFEVDAGETESVEVFEGQVDVQPLAGPTQDIQSVGTGQEFSAMSAKVVDVKTAPPADLITSESAQQKWQVEEEKVLSAHAKEAKKYREIMNRDVRSVGESLRKDAQGMFRSLKGGYDQFKKKR